MDSTSLATLITNFIVWYAVFLFSTTLHEASHSFVSARGGDDTAYLAGSATLNPVPHMLREKFGMIIVPIVSFFLYGGNWMLGWASAPFNPYWAARYPRRSFLMSLAGPLSHLLPAGVAWIVMVIGLRTGYFLPAFEDGYFVQAAAGNGLGWALAKLLNVLLMLNLILLVFNLLPVPPLDGSEIWYLFIKNEESRLRWRYNFSSYAMLGIIVAGVYLFPKVFPHVFFFAYYSLMSFGGAM